MFLIHPNLVENGVTQVAQANGWWTWATTVAITAAVLTGIRWALSGTKQSASKSFRIHVTMIPLTLVGIIVVVLSLPVGSEMRNNLVALVGIVLSAAIALASTTILGNALAGLQLRANGSFEADDYMRIGDHFGKVTGRGLFHTELQTEDGDLASLPNLFLVSQPVRVVRKRSTIVSASVSLGYGVPMRQAADCLRAAGRAAGLNDPFVQVLELGDFAIQYRVGGELLQVKELLTRRSLLRQHMLRELGDAGIEIASPTIMATRPLDPDETVVGGADGDRSLPEIDPSAPLPEEMMFDKAMKAGSIGRLRDILGEIEEALAEATKRAKDGDLSQQQQHAWAERCELLTERRAAFQATIGQREAELDGDAIE